MNWITTLERIIANDKPIRRKRHQSLIDRAGEWKTCACGELCKKLPRYNDNTPKDSALKRLGFAFYLKIQRPQWRKALATFAKIEARASYLLSRP